MTVAEILKQAQTLTQHERKELIKQLIDQLDVTSETSYPVSPTHWGQSLVQLIESMDLRDWEAPEFDDATGWVNAVRRREEERLKSFWDDEK